HQGHELYRQQRWQEAMASFEAAIRLNRKDELAKMYVSRCHHFIAHPPGPEWDGVWVMTAKS
ncbi:MAG: tetratricopeptide repeat protein, partial [Candidatus Riflebacteria bacterium]|nr:tetratricopeptide repeat protein [Candidatus Riflebacteria bacterium]